MKCTVCGAYNKPEYKKCIRCGNPLLSAEEEKKREKIFFEHQSPLKNTPTFREAIIVEEKDEEHIEKDVKPGTHKDVPDDIDFWSEAPKKKRSAGKKDKHMHVLSIKDESEDQPADSDSQEDRYSRTRRTSRPAKGSNLDKISKIREGQEVEVLLPPEKKPVKKKKVRKKRKIKVGRLILVSAVAGVIVVGLIVGFFYLFRGIFSGVSQIFTGHEGLPNDGLPLVERVFINGQTWHQITFYGEDGERVLVESPITESLPIQSNKAVLYLDDLSFVPEEDTQTEALPFIQVDLQASIFAKDGEETPLIIEPYKIEVPLSPLKIVYPTDPQMKVDYTQVLVKIKVDPGSRVKIDGVNLTDIVDTDGYVQKYVNLAEGLNEIEVEVETSKHRKTLEIINVTRPELDVSIELTEPPSQHYEDEVWINGTVEEDAIVSIVDTYNISADVSYEAVTETVLEDGTTVRRKPFKFRYRLSSYGWNDIEISALSGDGSRQASIIHRVERIPDHRQYTKKAWPILPSFTELKDRTGNYIGQIFACKGTIMEREDTDTSRMYLFNVGQGSVVKYIMIEYSGKQELLEGQTYLIYADVTGSYRNYPLLAGRFIYDWEPTPEEIAAAAATPTPAPTEAPTTAP